MRKVIIKKEKSPLYFFMMGVYSLFSIPNNFTLGGRYQQRKNDFETIKSDYEAIGEDFKSVLGAHGR